MSIIGFNLSKIHAELKRNQKGDIKINTNIKIQSIEKTSLAFDEKMGAIKIKFVYTVLYEPEMGLIELTGEIMTMQQISVVDSVVNQWAKDKTIQQDLTSVVMGNIMQKCSMQALIVARDVNLPAPIPLPKFSLPTQEAGQKAPVTTKKSSAKK